MPRCGFFHGWLWKTLKRAENISPKSSSRFPGYGRGGGLPGIPPILREDTHKKISGLFSGRTLVVHIFFSSNVSLDEKLPPSLSGPITKKSKAGRMWGYWEKQKLWETNYINIKLFAIMGIIFTHPSQLSQTFRENENYVETNNGHG